MNPVEKLLTTATVDLLVDKERFTVKFRHADSLNVIINDTSPYEGDVLIHTTRKELWFWNEDKDQYVQYYLKEKQDDPT